jgi:hypothetical protein
MGGTNPPPPPAPPEPPPPKSNAAASCGSVTPKGQAECAKTDTDDDMIADCKWCGNACVTTDDPYHKSCAPLGPSPTPPPPPPAPPPAPPPPCFASDCSRGTFAAQCAASGNAMPGQPCCHWCKTTNQTEHHRRRRQQQIGQTPTAGKCLLATLPCDSARPDHRVIHGTDQDNPNSVVSCESVRSMYSWECCPSHHRMLRAT